MIFTGIIVFLSLIVMYFWFPWRTRLKMNGSPLCVEVPFGILAYALHFGTFSGMMAAATAVVLARAFMVLMRTLVGHIKRGRYVPGVMTIEH